MRISGDELSASSPLVCTKMQTFIVIAFWVVATNNAKLTIITTRAEFEQQIVYSGRNALVRFRTTPPVDQAWNQLAANYSGPVLIAEVDCTQAYIELCSGGEVGYPKQLYGGHIRYYLAGEEHQYDDNYDMYPLKNRVEHLNKLVHETLLKPNGQRNIEEGTRIEKPRIYQLYGQQTDGEYLWLGAIPEGIPTAVSAGVGYPNLGIQYVSFTITKNQIRCFSQNSQIGWDRLILNQPYKSNCKSVLSRFRFMKMTDTLLILHEE